MNYKLIIAGSMLLLTACNADKGKDESKILKDSIVKSGTDTIANNIKKDSAETETYLEGIGGIRMGLTQTQLTAILGEPDSKGKAEKWDADGLVHQDWSYKSKGIQINMESNPNLADQVIFSVTITSPCNFRTKKNIGIGSTYNEVMAAYEKEIDKPASDKKQIVVGSIFGGIIVHFENEKAVQLFFGAAAE